MERLDVLAVGDVMVDVAVAAEALERGGHLRGAVRVRPGGSSANVAVWAAALGARSAVVGRVGADFAGQAVEAALAGRGVRTLLATDAVAPTGIFASVGETIVADRGANAGLAVADLPEELEAGAVLVSGYLLLHGDTEATAATTLDRAEAAWVGVDTASAPLLRAVGRSRFFDLTARASVLLANAHEAYVLTGEEPEQAARTLGKRYRLVCVTRGEAGAVAVLDGELRRADALRVSVVDPLGAGDAFAAGLLTMLVRGRALADALEEACRLASLAVASPDPWPA